MRHVARCMSQCRACRRKAVRCTRHVARGTLRAAWSASRQGHYTTLGAGDLLYIPYGWWHWLTNLEARRTWPPTSSSGPGSPPPRLRQDWAHPAQAHPCHICARTGLTPPTSSSGPGSPLPHLRRDWACRSHICAETGPPATSAPGLGSPQPHLRRDCPPLPHPHRDWARRSPNQAAFAVLRPPTSQTLPQPCTATSRRGLCGRWVVCLFSLWAVSFTQAMSISMSFWSKTGG